MATVEFQRVVKTYPNGASALSGIDLNIADGELLVLVGPSGCGKSTALRLLAGLDDVSSGRILIGGRDVTDIPPRQRDIAMVFQDYALYPHMTVRGNLEFPLRMRKMDGPEMARRVARVAEMLDMNQLLERLPRQLSGGQRQRVAMGRALVRDPSVFLMDEPLSNLDAKLRGQVRTEIAELQKKAGTTMVYVTHDQVEAMTMGDRVAVLQGGVLQQVASPMHVYSHPSNAFVAGFIGNPPMNLFPAHRMDSVAGCTLEVDGAPFVTLPASDRGLPAVAGALTLGIRPESLTLDSPGTGICSLCVTIDSVEYLGHEVLLHAHTNGTRALSLVARLPPTQGYASGDRIILHCERDGLYFFDEAGFALRCE